jgi:hypothetical protein
MPSNIKFGCVAKHHKTETLDEQAATIKRRDELSATLRTVESSLASLREEHAAVCGELVEARQAANASAAESDLLRAQLAEMSLALRRESSEWAAKVVSAVFFRACLITCNLREGRAQAGVEALETMLAASQGRMREAQAEAADLKRTVTEIQVRRCGV